MRFYYLIGFLIIYLNFATNVNVVETVDIDKFQQITNETQHSTTQTVNYNRPKERKQPHPRVKIGKKHKIIHRKIQNRLVTVPSSSTPFIVSSTPFQESTEFVFNGVDTNTNNNNYDDASSAQFSIKAIDLTVKVGETALLKCEINSTYSTPGTNPGVIWMQGKLGSVLTLNTNRITVDTRFEIVQQPIDVDDDAVKNKRDGQPLIAPIKDHNIQGLIEPQQSFYHLKITNVQLYDENEYACETSITKNSEDEPNLHSLIRLHVTQSPNFIESLTSENNLAVMEHGEVVLKCFAIGKPAPKIRWYRIEENNGFIRDLNHESTSLTLRNLTKNENSKYECIADNGILPSVSKKFSLTIYYLPSVKSIRKSVTQNLGQTVLLGCVIKSNPESAIQWYKSVITANKPKSNLTISLSNSNSFTLIDASDLKYQIHTFKQLNQTVSYLKIKSIDEEDYLTYKCEASNIVGKSESYIDLLSHHHHLNRNHVHHFHNKNHNKHQNHHSSNKNNGHIKIFNSESSEYEDGFDDYTDRFNGRTLDVSTNNSKYQYQTNKSNRIADSAENTDFISSKSASNFNRAKFQNLSIFSIVIVILSVNF